MTRCFGTLYILREMSCLQSQVCLPAATWSFFEQLWDHCSSTVYPQSISLAWQNREDLYIIYVFSFIVWYKNACYLEKSLHLKELFLL